VNRADANKWDSTSEAPSERRSSGFRFDHVIVSFGSGRDGQPFGFIARKPALKVRCP